MKEILEKKANDALKLYPQNIDAKLFLLSFEKNFINKLEKLNTLLEEETKKLENDGYFKKEYIGEFWLYLETRPYMKILYEKIKTLIELGRYKEAIAESEKMIKLCKHDNLGIRYILMGLYCILEDFKKFEKIYKKYNYDCMENNLMFAFYNFKKGDYITAKEYILKLKKQNPFLLLLATDSQLEKNLNRIDEKFLDENTMDIYMEESINFFLEYNFIFDNIPGFIKFISNVYNNKKIF